MTDRSLFPRLISSALLIALLWATVYWSRAYWWICLLVCEAVVLLGLKELLALLRVKKVQVFELYTLAGGVALTAAIFFSSFPRNLAGDLVFWVLFGWSLGLFFFQATQPTPEGAIQTLFLSIASLLYVAFLFGFLIKINYLDNLDGRRFVFYTFATVYAADMVAYAIGSLFGRRSLAPKISPRKTVEGAIGGLIGACVASLVLQRFFLSDFSALHMIVLGFLIGIVSQIGDLWESLLKRDAQAKDSGRTIPGMGGVLDLMDGLLFCAPLVYLYLKVVLKV